MSQESVSTATVKYLSPIGERKEWEFTLPLILTDLTDRRKEDLWLVSLRRNYIKTEPHHFSPFPWSTHRVKRSVSASLAGEVYMTSDGLAECDWIREVLESACDRVHDLTLHRRRSINLPNEPTANVMKADSALHLDLSTGCIVGAKKRI